MITIKEASLQECLQVAGLIELPRSISPDENVAFMKAIVLTLRTNGQEAYCIAENDGDNGLSIVSDFGPSVAIRSIISIHPTQMIDKKVLPDFRSDKQIISYLCKSHYDNVLIERLLSKKDKTPEQIKADRDTIRGYVFKIAIEAAKKKENERERVENIKSYTSRIKNEKD